MDLREKPKYAIFSVMGPHAGEDSASIFTRKAEDINKIGKTFWFHRSYMARPDTVQKFCKEAIQQNCNPICLFLLGASVPTKESDAAKEYSIDSYTWNQLPIGLGPVTGNIKKKNYALIFNELTVRNFGEIYLWDYVFFDSQELIQTARGASTVCGIFKNTGIHHNIKKTKIRQVIAIGRLAAPYAVWLR
jgi:hypothetical protein